MFFLKNWIGPDLAQKIFLNWAGPKYSTGPELA